MQVVISLPMLLLIIGLVGSFSGFLFYAIGVKTKIEDSKMVGEDGKRGTVIIATLSLLMTLTIGAAVALYATGYWSLDHHLAVLSQGVHSAMSSATQQLATEPTNQDPSVTIRVPGPEILPLGQPVHVDDVRRVAGRALLFIGPEVDGNSLCYGPDGNIIPTGASLEITRLGTDPRGNIWVNVGP